MNIAAFLRSHRELLFIVGVALFVRLAAVIPVHAGGYTSDEKEYVSMGRHLAHGGSFIDSNGERSTRAPLLPYALALIDRWLGESLVLPHIMGALIGTAIVILGYVLSMRVLGDHASALIASGVIAVYPGLMIYAGMLQTETLYTAFLLLAFLFAYRIIDSGSWKDSVALGIVSGLASLTRVVFVGFLPLLLVMIWWEKRWEGKAALLLLYACVVWMVVLAPWTIRNYTIYHAWIPVSSGGGNTLLTGNNPFATGTWKSEAGFEEWYRQKALEHGVQNVERLNELQHSDVSRTIALEYMKDHPLKVLVLAMKKAYIFWIYPIAHTDSNVPLQAAIALVDGILLFGVAIGCVAIWDERSRLMPIYGAIIFFFITQVVLHAEARFRLPLVPLLCLVFGQGSSLVLDPVRRTNFLAVRSHRIASTLLGGCVVSVYAVTAWMHFTGVP
jgi:4-amino-4-deoxy-L-arabinose transferase-like glycosyltransferase